MKLKRSMKYKKFSIDRKYIIMGLALALVSMFIDIWPFVFLSLFCFLNSMVLSIDRYVSAPVDLEFSTFSAILFTKVYGLPWGIAAGLITKLVAMLYNKRVTVDHFFMMGGYTIAAFVASMIPGNNIIIIGVIVTLIVNLYIVFVSKFITMLSFYETLMYGSSNVIFNTVLFIGFSEFLYKLMIFL